MWRLHPVADAAHHIEERGRAVGRDIADQRHDLVLRAIHRRQLLDHGAQHAPRAHRHDHRMLRHEIALELRGGGFRDPDRARCRFRIAGHDLAEIDAVVAFELVRKLKAMADRVIEPDLDQFLADGEGDEPLRRLPRHAELARDLILGIAGDIIEPARPSGVIEPICF